MDPSYWRRLVRQFGRADLVVSNPPYGYCGKSITEPTVRRLLGEEMPPWIVRRSEIAFLAAGMEIVKQGGTLAYVLPYSLMEYHRGALLRVFARNGLAEIIELDAGVFRGTEAKTAVFVYRKGEVRNMVDIYQASRSGHLRVRQPIDVGEAGIMKSSALPTLATMGVSVRRGKCSQAELQRDRVPYFHTTSFAAYARKVVDLGRPRTATDQVVASVGDILLPRVGSRCLDYEALVRSGRRAITDCVLRIRAPEDIRRPLWRFLISDKGRAWRKNLIRGSCARFLAQEHLHTAPIPL